MKRKPNININNNDNALMRIYYARGHFFITKSILNVDLLKEWQNCQYCPRTRTAEV